MALRKLYIVVDCENDEQKEAVQTAFNELSNTRALTVRKGCFLSLTLNQLMGELLVILR